MSCYVILYCIVLHYIILYYTLLSAISHAAAFCTETAWVGPVGTQVLWCKLGVPQFHLVGMTTLCLAGARLVCIAYSLARGHAPNLPSKMMPTKIAWFKSSGEFPMGLGIPPFMIKILLESNPLKSRILVRRLAVPYSLARGHKTLAGAPTSGVHK